MELPRSSHSPELLKPVVLLVMQLSLGSSRKCQCQLLLFYPLCRLLSLTMVGCSRGEAGETSPRCSSPYSHGQLDHTRHKREIGR